MWNAQKSQQSPTVVLGETAGLDKHFSRSETNKAFQQATESVQLPSPFVILSQVAFDILNCM